MMYDELIKQLKYCANSDPICEATAICPFYDQREEETHDYRCVERMMSKAADAIEGLELRCKNFEEALKELDEKLDEVEQKKGEWIPVTERLPKENGFYLCLYKHKASGGVAIDEGLSILQWINNKWGINDIYLVTHWAPLPQPQKDGEA